MFENACKFNEPDSQIYKDALTLQNVVKHAAKTLVEEDMDDTSVPNVIGYEIENMVFCYQNRSDILWEKTVLMIEKNFLNSRKTKNLQKFWDH